MALQSKSPGGEICRVLRQARLRFFQLTGYKSFVRGGGYWWYRWHPDAWIGINEEWERPLEQYLLHTGSCLVDAGSHIGRWTLRASPFYHRILAFEPDSVTNQVLRRNLARNNVQNVRVFEVALSRHRKEAVLFGYGPPACGSLRNVHVSGRAAKNAKIVKVQPLDDFTNYFSIPMVLKIDVEGAELSVLEGAADTLEKFKPRVVVEVHFRNELGSIIDEMGKHGYIIVGIFTDRSNPKGQVYLVADHAEGYDGELSIGH